MSQPVQSKTSHFTSRWYRAVQLLCIACVSIGLSVCLLVRTATADPLFEQVGAVSDLFSPSGGCAPGCAVLTSPQGTFCDCPGVGGGFTNPGNPGSGSGGGGGQPCADPQCLGPDPDPPLPCANMLITSKGQAGGCGDKSGGDPTAPGDVNPPNFLPCAQDIQLPSEGFSWMIGRTFLGRQPDPVTAGEYEDSDTYQGRNWFQTSQPALLFVEDGSDADEDFVYIIVGTSNVLQFNRVDGGSPDPEDEFRGVNGTIGVVQFAEGAGSEPDTYTLTDIYGRRSVFFGFDADASPAEGMLWKIIDPAGNTAYVGDKTTASTAISNGYDADGRITTAYDTNGRRYTYTYTTLNGTKRLTSVVVAKFDDPNWVNTGNDVEYEYYGSSETYGSVGDLKLVTVTTPLSDSGVELETKTYYRYWKDPFNASTNPGHDHLVQYVVQSEGLRQFDWAGDSTFDEDFLTATESSLKPYASLYMEYDDERRVTEAWFNGDCGCGSANDGTYTFEYEANTQFTDTSSYDADWAGRVISQRPDGSYLTQYYDEVWQPIHNVITDVAPDSTSPTPDEWVREVTRDSNGRVTTVSTPANVSAYTHDNTSSWDISTSTSAGLVRHYERVSSGDLTGLIDTIKYSKGTSGSKYLDRKHTFTTASKTVDSFTLKRPFYASDRVYSQAITTGTTGSYETTISYTFYTGDAALMPKQVTITNPTVSTANNGSGSSTTRKVYYRKDGTIAFVEAEDGIFTYFQFTNGQLVKRIDDVKTNGTFPAGDDPNSDFGITETANGSDRTTTYAYDEQGRIDTTTHPDGRVAKNYYSKLADGRLVSLHYADYETSPSIKYFGPVQYIVRNHNRMVEAQASIALSSNESTLAIAHHVDESESDLIEAIETTTNKLGDLAQLSTSTYNSVGHTVQENHIYFDISSSLPGTEGTNYDATYYAYDDAGRGIRTKAPTGTITRTNYDSIGRMSSSEIGTNDNGDPGGEASGTNNMVKLSESTYDSGNDGGNSYVTKQTLYVEDSATDKRETTFEHDIRGNVLLRTNPTAPHTFRKYDNMNRVIASGQFSSTASIVVGSDDPTTETTNRLSLSQTFFDEMGRVWKSQSHNIDESDGSDDDNLQTLTWFDEAGRVIKVDGGALVKSQYDRLGRPTHSFGLAKDNDTVYGDADDVSGDHVLVENQLVYESSDSDDVIMSVRIDRFHDDDSAGSTGELDSNADGDDQLITPANIEGRIQIIANWFDRFGRLTDTVNYGTYGGNSFDRDGLSVPARSDTALLREIEYDTDGTRLSVTDPKGIETRFLYDDLGRQTVIIRNYVDGTPSGDTDHFVRNEYTDGLRVKYWVDLDGDGTEDTGDQVTEYTYGTTKGATDGDSKIATGHLLQEIAYPDSASASDVVSLAYNAQGQLIWKEDQEGNVIETKYDDSGRATDVKATTIDVDFDSTVKRISTVYDSVGRPSTVTQYDATTGGNALDQVKYSYGPWGLPEEYDQDNNSTLDATLSWNMGFVYEKATSGRNTIRQTRFDLPTGTRVSYTYSGTGNLLDDDASRVTHVKLAGTTIATYDYSSVGHVVGATLNEPDVMWEQFGSTSGDYPGLDRFNRPTEVLWQLDLATDRPFVDHDLAYDRSSHIIRVVDNIHTDISSGYGLHDELYTYDNLNRLTQTEKGNWNGSSIDNDTGLETWTYDETGNWDHAQLDLEGNGTFTASGEFDDDRTHGDDNSLTARDTDDDGTDDHSPTYDANGNMTSDDDMHKYTYDAFNRLVIVKNQSDRVVAKYRYNGVHHRITMQQDFDSDGDVDVNDPEFNLVYVPGWRLVATYRDTDSDPKEVFVYHAPTGSGCGLTPDSVILRDRDANTAWTSGADGTLEERVYYPHGRQGGPVALIEDDADMIEWVGRSPYGHNISHPRGDADSDYTGADSADVTRITAVKDAAGYDNRCDLDSDGVVGNSDVTLAQNNSTWTGGWDVLSNAGNRKGLAGYEYDWAFADTAHVRHRVYRANLGRWTKRDPAGYVNGPNFYSYASANPILFADPSGLLAIEHEKILTVKYETRMGISGFGFTFGDTEISWGDWDTSDIARLRAWVQGNYHVDGDKRRFNAITMDHSGTFPYDQIDWDEAVAVNNNPSHEYLVNDDCDQCYEGIWVYAIEVLGAEYTLTTELVGTYEWHGIQIGGTVEQSISGQPRKFGATVVTQILICTDGIKDRASKKTDEWWNISTSWMVEGSEGSYWSLPRPNRHYQRKMTFHDLENRDLLPHSELVRDGEP